MLSNFFIDRPIFAWVVALLIMLGGGISLLTLPIAQYPSIAPTQISVTANYPGASAQMLQDSVTQVIEQQMKGLDHLTYLASTADSSSGQTVITLTFDTGTDPDIAQVQVQNKLQLATARLPEEVSRQGINVAKSTSNFLLIVGLMSEDGSMKASDISDYIASSLQDPVSRLPGVGDTQVFGAQYAMRIWADPARMQQYKLNPSDIISAVQAQNAQVPGGQIGASPLVSGQQITMSVIAQSRLQTIEQFENIFLRVKPDGSALLLKDVARIEVEAENFNNLARINGQPSSALAIKLAVGANALQTADAVKAYVSSMSEFFPPGLKVIYPYDTTPFVRISIEEVAKTLVEAVILVFLVMYLFLQNFRATLIPTIAVPVVLLGVFGVMAAAGFTINTLTMFGMVLAIGLLVDDAIVVVENVERIMEEQGLPPKEAAKQSMKEITSALVGVAMVLCVVFLPMAFFGGSAGVIYRQFSITIASAMILSVAIALILTPALCATMLKPKKKAEEGGNKKTGPLARFFGSFNSGFQRASHSYQHGVTRVIGRPWPMLVAFAVIVGAMALMFLRLPTSFLPDEDQGFLFAQAQLPSGATFERTEEVLSSIEKYFLEEEKDTVESILTVAGYSFSGNGQNNAMIFIRLKDWSVRGKASLRAPAIVARSMGKLSRISGANSIVFMPPAVMELGNATGFDFELLDQGNLGHEALMQARNQLLQEANHDPRLMGVRPNGMEDTEQYQLNIDMAKAGSLSVSLNEISTTIAAYWGSSYINDFQDRGRTKRVFLQAEPSVRQQASDFSRYYIRNTQNQMVPFTSFISGESQFGSPRLERFNGIPSVEILGQPAPGQSSGQAMQIMEELAAKLPPGISYAWTGLSYQEQLSGAQAPAMYALSLIIVFLCLAALYESWAIPLAVLLVVPLGVLGALGGTWLRGLSNDVYFQVGLLSVIGLCAKNAILIVEFARDQEAAGKDLLEATVEASGLRLRPILMTTMAFVLGVLPMAINTGAGSGAQNAIGTGVIAGVMSSMILGIFYIPVFFVMVSKLFGIGVGKNGGPGHGAPPGGVAPQNNEGGRS